MLKQNKYHQITNLNKKELLTQSVKADTVNPVEKDRQEIVNKDQTSKTVGGGYYTLHQLRL